MTCEVCGMLCCVCELEDKAKAFLRDLVVLCEAYGAVISSGHGAHVGHRVYVEFRIAEHGFMRHSFDSIDGKGIHP